MKISESYMPYLTYQTYYRIVNPDSTKTPLVLLHGGPGSSHNYFETLDRLAEEDDRMLIMYDQLGCGNSYIDGHTELWNADTWIKELISLREHLHLDSIHLLGQSWGGMQLLEYVCNYHATGLKSIILSSTLPSSKMWGEEQHRMIRELPTDMQEAIEKATKSGDYTDEAYIAAEAEYMLRHCSSPVTEDSPECLRRPVKKGRESYLTAWGPNEFTPQGTLKDYDVTDKLSSIKEPALIISGGNDLCTPYIAKSMYDSIPDSRWELFRACRHMCFIEDNEQYIKILKEWLNAHD